MGATASTPVTAYAVPVSDPREGESAVFRHTNYRDELLGVCKFGDGDEARTLAQAFEHGVKVSKDRPCYGYRPIRPDGSAGEYLWATFGEAHTRIINFARGIEKLQCCPVNPDDKLKKLGIYSRNRMEWAIAMQACYKTNVVVVPLYDTLGPEAVEYVLRQAEISTVVCTSKELSCLAKVKESGQCPTFSRIILIDDTEDAGPFTGESLLKFSQVEDAGSQAEDIDLAALAPTPENIAMFCYTSGTTGDPKGAMESHGSILADAAGAISGGLALTPEDVHLSYLPLAHMFEVAVQNMMSAHGGAVGFFQGDTLKLTDDIAALRPTIFPSVPRLYNRIYDKIMSGVQTQGGVKAFMFNQAYAAKKEGLKAGVLTHGMWDPLVFKKVAARVGLDRCRLMVTGSAPIAGHVMEFLRIVFSCPVQEGYGQTECAAALSITHPNDLTVGHVGGPLPCNEVKLVDVADMGYTAKDQPNPRGEVCCRGPNVFPGYYKMEEKTREAIDEEGWLHTGDIGVIMPNGAIKIIDRKKNIFKLSQGEYVAAEKIENVYIKSPLIMQCFVYGDSLQSCLVGIIVPDPEQFKTWAAEHGGTEDLEKLKGPMLKYLDTVGKEGGLKGFELVKAIHIEASPWTVEEPQSVLTPTFKLKRVDAKKRYQAQIDAMYSSGISTVAGKTGLKQGED